MCAFYHKPDEKLNVEQETENFYDPFVEDYEPDRYDPECEGECDSEHSPKSSQSNTNTNTNINIINLEPEENNSATKLESKHSIQSATLEEHSDENAWANEEFGLEAVLQKPMSETSKTDHEALSSEPDSQTYIPIIEKEPIKAEIVESPKKTESSVKQTKDNEIVSYELKSIVLGNNQQIATATLVEKIVSQAPSSGKSKFFNFREESKDHDEDVISDIFNMDYNTFCQSDESKQVIASSNTLHPYQELKSLYVIPEESESHDSVYNSSKLTAHFSSL
jgi:hypothetical protein